MTAWPAVLGRAGRGAWHRRRATSGRFSGTSYERSAPSAWLPSAEDIAAATGVDDVPRVLRRLHAEDFLRVDTSGGILSAYRSR
jgi:hypothetical protein